MTSEPRDRTGPSKDMNASDGALKREQEVADKEMPVKQHNPTDQGLNPGQKGPAQPSGNDR